jgi:hypothetical protein
MNLIISESAEETAKQLASNPFEVVCYYYLHIFPSTKFQI